MRRGSGWLAILLTNHTTSLTHPTPLRSGNVSIAEAVLAVSRCQDDPFLRDVIGSHLMEAIVSLAKKLEAEKAEKANKSAAAATQQSGSGRVHEA